MNILIQTRWDMIEVYKAVNVYKEIKARLAFHTLS